MLAAPLPRQAAVVPAGGAGGGASAGSIMPGRSGTAPDAGGGIGGPICGGSDGTGAPGYSAGIGKFSRRWGAEKGPSGGGPMPGGGGTSPSRPVYADTAGGFSGTLGVRALSARSELRVGVNDLVGAGRLGQVGADRGRDVVQVEQPQCRAEVVVAQLRGLWRRGVLRGADHAAHELHRAGQVGNRESTTGRAGVGVVDVVRVGERVGCDVQHLLEIHLHVDQGLGDLLESLELLGGLIARSRDEPLHLGHRGGEIRQRSIEVGPASVEHAG